MHNHIPLPIRPLQLLRQLPLRLCPPLLPRFRLQSLLRFVPGPVLAVLAKVDVAVREDSLDDDIEERDNSAGGSESVERGDAARLGEA